MHQSVADMHIYFIILEPNGTLPTCGQAFIARSIIAKDNSIPLDLKVVRATNTKAPKFGASLGGLSAAVATITEHRTVHGGRVGFVDFAPVPLIKRDCR